MKKISFKFIDCIVFFCITLTMMRYQLINLVEKFSLLLSVLSIILKGMQYFLYKKGKKL